MYLPIGTLEWHAEHLPVGLDALNAEAICLRAAVHGGGVVGPTLYYGTGGSHGSYPWTITMPSDREITALLARTLSRLNDLGVLLAVVFTGHFAREQVACVRQVAHDWNERGYRMRALGLSVDQAAGLAITPDHAGRFETTLLRAHMPDRVDLGRIPPMRPDEAGEDPWGQQRHAPGHSLWGVVGPDPRDVDAADGPTILDGIVRWLLAEVDGAGG